LFSRVLFYEASRSFREHPPIFCRKGRFHAIQILELFPRSLSNPIYHLLRLCEPNTHIHYFRGSLNRSSIGHGSDTNKQIPVPCSHIENKLDLLHFKHVPCLEGVSIRMTHGNNSKTFPAIFCNIRRDRLCYAAGISRGQIARATARNLLGISTILEATFYKQLHRESPNISKLSKPLLQGFPQPQRRGSYCYANLISNHFASSYNFWIVAS
jgi:hypothetical protein